MATIGNTATPSGSFNDYLGGLANTMAIQVTMPTAGVITNVTAYVGGHGAAITGRVVIWDSSGNVLAQSGDLTFPQGSGGIGGQGWVTGTVGGANGYSATTNQVLRLGWWVHENEQWEWTEDTLASGEYQATDNSNTAPVTPTTFTNTNGKPGIYATYSTGLLYVRRGGAWTVCPPLQVRRTGVWTGVTGTFVRRSGAWTQVQ